MSEMKLSRSVNALTGSTRYTLDLPPWSVINGLLNKADTTLMAKAEDLPVADQVRMLALICDRLDSAGV